MGKNQVNFEEQFLCFRKSGPAAAPQFNATFSCTGLSLKKPFGRLHSQIDWFCQGSVSALICEKFSNTATTKSVRLCLDGFPLFILLLTAHPFLLRLRHINLQPDLFTYCKNKTILTVCSQTSGVWKEKKCVQVSAFESMRTGSGGAKPMFGGLYKHKAHIQNIVKKTSQQMLCVARRQGTVCGWVLGLSPPPSQSSGESLRLCSLAGVVVRCDAGRPTPRDLLCSL